LMGELVTAALSAPQPELPEAAKEFCDNYTRPFEVSSIYGTSRCMILSDGWSVANMQDGTQADDLCALLNSLDCIPMKEKSDDKS